MTITESVARHKNGTHQALVDATPIQMEYALWLVTPIKEPRTKTAWAAEHNIRRDLLWRWERSAWLRALIEQDRDRKEATWAALEAELERIATAGESDMARVAAIKEIGKLWKKYPSEKLEITAVQRVSYVDPGALRSLGATLAIAAGPDLEDLEPVDVEPFN